MSVIFYMNTSTGFLIFSPGFLEESLKDIAVGHVSAIDTREALTERLKTVPLDVLKMLCEKVPACVFSDLRQVRLDRANLRGLVLGCIEAKFCKKICV